jgi:hypothetical protein
LALWPSMHLSSLTIHELNVIFLNYKYGITLPTWDLKGWKFVH